MNINPDYIVVYGLHAYDAYDDLMGNEVLAGLDAVQNGKVYFCPKGGQPMNGTGVENVMYIQWQAQLLYPELFEDIDMHQVVKDFYSTYMGHDFSDSDVDAMLAGKNAPDA